MSVQSYRDARRNIPSQELAKHRGKWVAFSRDGTCVVASCKNLERLEKKIVAAGKDPQEMVYEFLTTEETMVGGAEIL